MTHRDIEQFLASRAENAKLDRIRMLKLTLLALCAILWSGLGGF